MEIKVNFLDFIRSESQRDVTRLLLQNHQTFLIHRNSFIDLRNLTIPAATSVSRCGQVGSAAEFTWTQQSEH